MTTHTLGGETARLAHQADECCELAKEALANGDKVTFIAAISLAAQIVQLARITALTSTPTLEQEGKQ